MSSTYSSRKLNSVCTKCGTNRPRKGSLICWDCTNDVCEHFSTFRNSASPISAGTHHDQRKPQSGKK